MYIDEALKLYAQEQGKEFTLLYWWTLVREDLKWNDQMLDQAQKKLRIDDSRTYTTSSGDNTNDASFNTLRPMGQKLHIGRKGKSSSIERVIEKSRGMRSKKKEALKELFNNLVMFCNF